MAEGACSSADCAYIISACHLLWSRLGCRTWIEWVPSDDNPADGLSGAGLLDTWTVQQGWQLTEHPAKVEGAAIHPLAYIRYRARLIQRHSRARSKQSSDAEKKREARCSLAEVFKFDGYEAAQEWLVG